MSAQTSDRTSGDGRRETTKKEYEFLRLKVADAREKIKPTHSFDVEYWTAAADASELSAELYEAEMHLAIRKWKEENGNDTKAWWITSEAHHLVDRIKASHYEKVRYRNQAAQIERGGPLRRASQGLLTPSHMGFGMSKVGVGKRTKSQQSKFKKDLINFYDAAINNPRKPEVVLSVHDSATGHERLKSAVTGAHLVPRSLGKDILVAIFGADVEEELNTPLNGLLLHTDVEEAMDDGAIAIVPNLPDDPSTQEVTVWESTEPKNYKWRVIDPEAEILDEPLEVISEDPASAMTIRDLNGKQLSFKNDMRPRARYLFFLFVVAQLRLAWRQEYRRDRDPSYVPTKQLGKGFWATKGRYLERPFLLALADEIGQDTNIVENIPMVPGDDNEPNHTGVVGIAKLLQFRREEDYDSDEEGTE